MFGANQNQKANDLASTGLVYTITSNLILLIVLLVYIIFFLKKELEGSYFFYSCLVFLFRILFTSYTNFLSVTYRTKNDFNSLSLINNYLTIFRFLSVFLIINFGFWGYLFREFLSSFIEMVLMHKMRSLFVSLTFKWDDCIRLFKVGFPLFISSYFYMIAESIPKLFIIQFGSVEQLGLLSPSIMMLNFAALFGKSINSYLYPKMANEFGSNGNKNEIWKLCIAGYKASFLGSVIIFPIMYISIIYFPMFFPKYGASQTYLLISIWAVFFLGYKTGNNIFSILSKGSLSILNAFVNLIYTVLCFFILRLFFEDLLLISSLSIVISSFFMYISTMFLSWYSISRGNQNI